MSNRQIEVGVQDLYREAGVGHIYHWIKGVSPLTDGRGRNLAY